MKRLATIIALSALFMISPASSQPEVSHTTFYQENLEHGEEITFGIQFEDSESDIDYAVAKAYKGWKQVDFTTLLDRQNDNFYAGSLGPVEGGQTYKVEIEGCNTQNECVTKTVTRHATCQVGAFNSCWG